MLRGNLSSRPFYNDRVVTLLLVAVGLGALALTVFNVNSLMTLSEQRSQIEERRGKTDAQTQRIRGQAAAITRTVDRQALQGLAGATREANALINQRTFSWTTFFGVLEKTLPMDVHLVSVAPKVEKGEIKVTMTVVAKRADELDTFVQALWGTNVFYDVLPHAQQRNDDGTLGATIEMFYFPPTAPGVKKSAGTGRP